MQPSEPQALKPTPSALAGYKSLSMAGEAFAGKAPETLEQKQKRLAGNAFSSVGGLFEPTLAATPALPHHLPLPPQQFPLCAQFPVATAPSCHSARARATSCASQWKYNLQKRKDARAMEAVKDDPSFSNAYGQIGWGFAL